MTKQKEVAGPVMPKVKVVMARDGNHLIEDKPRDCRVLSKAISHAEAYEIADIYNKPETHELGAKRLASVAFK